MTVLPCRICGYDSPCGACPHCGSAPIERSLAQPPAGPLRSILPGLMAVPMGLYFLTKTRGVKRWLIPPLLITSLVLVFVLWWSFSGVNALIESNLPEDISFGKDGWAWLQGLSERWEWLKASWAGLVLAAEWLVNRSVDFFTSRSLRFLTYFLLSSLVAWYVFSIAYEALAGPFLDEIQGRLEARWFGADPRSRIQRPNEIPTQRCVRLSTVAGVAGLGAAIALTVFVSFWLGLLVAPLFFVAASLRDREYGEWLRWVIRVEYRALLASVQASIVTGLLLVLALPLYFIPVVGYFLFAGVAGFATAVSLLDIPFERREWRFRQRMAFLFRNLPGLIAFGATAGVLLAVPIFGPVLMVPAASVGGVWFLCRVDKSSIRPRGARTDGPE